jgi:hypothetical protein
MYSITKFLDDYLSRTGRKSIDPVEANALLAKAGILGDSKDRPGKPLRELLRKGHFPHAFQSGGKGSSWTIPLSSKGRNIVSNYSTVKQQKGNNNKLEKVTKKVEPTHDISQLKSQLEEARLKYKPENVKYLLVAEAPPNSLDRFFYYENVREHDYLFLGVSQALYPDIKEKFLSSKRSSEIKSSILQKLKNDGFYLLDLSELPLSILNSDLQSQLPYLVEKMISVTNKDTQIILIKANVYDIAFNFLNQKFENIINQRITFPGQGGQRNFQDEFKQALKKANYYGK